MNRLAEFKKYTAIILFLAFTVMSAGPLTASAQISGPQPQSTWGTIVAGASCAAGGALGNYLVELVTKGLQHLLFTVTGLNIMKWLNLADEVPTLPVKLTSKEQVRDLIARCGARAILNNMTNRMIGAVRTSGRQGKPGFVENWREFLAKGQYRGEDIFRSMLAGTNICPHFKSELFTIYNAIYQPNLNTQFNRFGNLDPYNLRAGCTLPSGWTIANYSANFVANGGWDVLVKLAEPQNNFFGSFLMSLSELETQRSQGAYEDIIEAMTGQGMIARRSDEANRQQRLTSGVGYCSNNSKLSCTVLTEYQDCFDPNAPSAYCVVPRDDCLIRGVNGQCVKWGNIITPGGVLSQTVGAVINNELAWVTSIDEMEELMANLTALLLERILNLAKPDVTEQERYPYERYVQFEGDPDIGNLPSAGQPPPPGGVPPPPTPPPIGSGGPGTWTCGDGYVDTAVPPPGSGVSVEQCDGTNLNGNTCTSVGYSGGTLGCYPAGGSPPGTPNECTFDYSACTGTPSLPACNNGIDDDLDGFTDYPNDSGCSSPTDNDEVLYKVALCSGTNYGPPCEPPGGISADIADLSSIGFNNSAKSINATAAATGKLHVELCLDVNFVNCTQINGSIPDLNTIPSIGNNTVSSIIVQQL